MRRRTKLWMFKYNRDNTVIKSKTQITSTYTIPKSKVKIAIFSSFKSEKVRRRNMCPCWSSNSIGKQN